MARYDLLYRYSKDGGASWTDITEIVNTAYTTITHNLCSTQFKSVLDTATFRLPAAPSNKKNDFIEAIFGANPVIVEIYAPGDVDVLWDEDNVQWTEQLDALWSDAVATFTGYVDRSSLSLKSYPLTPDVTINLKDVSSLNLDNKVDDNIYWKYKTITQIVKALLDHAGYLYTDNSVGDADNRVIPAFVIDKDNSKTYREYIDTLLFEAGGYVLDFIEDGQANIAHLDWKDETPSPVLIDNPLLSEGLTTSASYLPEDGVKVKWSTLDRKEGAVVYRDGISRSMGEDGYLKGLDIPNEGYWPPEGYARPTYQQFSADFLDYPYLRQETISRNEDLSIIAVENVSAYIQATKGTEKFDEWQYPTTSDQFEFDFDLNPNPTIWPTKAWYLLRNNSGATVNLQFFTLRGDVTYRNKIVDDTVPSDARKPKEYTTAYVFTESHASSFAQFYWHFLQTSRYIARWSGLGNENSLGSVVRVTHKGTGRGQDYIIVGKTYSWVGHTMKVEYSSVGVSAFSAYTLGETGVQSGSSTSQGATFIPTVDSDGNLSWTNDQGLENPPSVPIVNKVFKIVASQSAFAINKRSKDGDEIRLTSDISGFGVVSDITWSFSEGVHVNGSDSPSYTASGSVVTIRIPHNNSYSNGIDVTLSATCNGELQTKSYKLTPSVIENPVIFFGCVAPVPEAPENINLITGDYFVSNSAVDGYSKGVCYEYNQDSNTWGMVPASDSAKMLTALKEMMKDEVDLAGLSKNSVVSWFNNIVANQITANSIFAKMANVEEITVGRKATINGNVVNDALSVVNGKDSSGSISISSNSNSHHYYKYSEVLAKFPQYTEKDYSISYNGASYTKGYYIPNIYAKKFEDIDETHSFEMVHYLAVPISFTASRSCTLEITYHRGLVSGGDRFFENDVDDLTGLTYTINNGKPVYKIGRRSASIGSDYAYREISEDKYEAYLLKDFVESFSVNLNANDTIKFYATYNNIDSLSDYVAPIIEYHVDGVTWGNHLSVSSNGIWLFNGSSKALVSSNSYNEIGLTIDGDNYTKYLTWESSRTGGFSTPTNVNIKKNGTTIVSSANTISYNSSGLYVDGTKVLSSDEYYTSYSASFDYASTSATVEINADLIIKSTAGSLNIGSSTKRFGNIYGTNLYGIAQGGSARAIKHQIEKYDADAVALLNAVNIVKYKYIPQYDPAQISRYGFIADDTAEELSTPNHDVMDLGSCIGILIKAVQELSAKVNELEERLAE